MAGAFKFSSQDEAALRRDLSDAAIAELARALSVPARYAVFEFPGERRVLARFEAVLALDPQDIVLPDAFRRWLEERATIAKLNLKTERSGKTRSRLRGQRLMYESLVLRVLKRHGRKTGGPAAARLLAIALRARLGIASGDAEAQRQALMAARRRLRACDPLDPAQRPSGRLGSDREEWGDSSYRPVEPWPSNR